MHLPQLLIKVKFGYVEPNSIHRDSLFYPVVFTGWPLRNTPWKGLPSALHVFYSILLVWLGLDASSRSQHEASGAPYFAACPGSASWCNWQANGRSNSCVILLGEAMAVSVPQRNPFISQRSISRASGEFNLLCATPALALIVVGSISTLAFHSDLSSRADGGYGVVTILKTCLAVGLCVFASITFFNQSGFIIWSVLAG